MDNVTHTLTGLALARAGLDRICPRATLLIILAANIPDADIVALAGGQLQHLEMHRGYSHSLVLLPILAWLPVLLTAATFGRRLPKSFPWMGAWLLSAIGVASHLLLDWTNSYGIRLLLPFSSTWYHLDLNGLWDVAIMMILVFAAVWPFLARLVSQEIGASSSRGRGVAIFALVFFVLYDGGRGVLHARALAQLDSRIYDGQAPLLTAALPQPTNPLMWRGVVETSDSYRVYEINALGEFDPRAAEIFFKARETPDIVSAKHTEAFRFFLYFARFPAWSEAPSNSGEGEAKLVRLTDLRFGLPDSGGFHCTAIIDQQSQVLRSWFRY
jgi:inner membrane protein